jgi:hypothetical protein
LLIGEGKLNRPDFDVGDDGLDLSNFAGSPLLLLET